MEINEISRIIESLCPQSLASFEFNGFLNRGRTQIKKLAFTLGYSYRSIETAIKRNVDLLIVHNAPERLVSRNKYSKDIETLIKRSNLSLYRLHLPLDFAKDGIIYQLCQIMKFEGKPLELDYKGNKIKGGVYMIEADCSMKELINRVKLLLPKTIRVVGNHQRRINKIAVTSGDGCKPEFLIQIKPDVLICGLLNQESIRIANDLDIMLIEATSHATESRPLKMFVDKKRHLFNGVSVSFIDIKDDISDCYESL